MNGLVLVAACVCAVTGQLYTPGLPITAPSSQFHAQDEFGQFSFGHSGGPSARTEARNAYGVTTGGYQYIDANGLLQTVQYIADPINGFRVSATNLPVAPSALAVTPLVAVEETAEVKAARAEWQAAWDAAATAAAAAPEEAVEEVVEAVVEAVVEERKKREAEEEETVLPAALPIPYALGGAGLFAGLPADIVANIDTAVPTVAYAGLPGVAPYAGLTGFAGVAPYNGLAGVAPYAGLHAGFAGVAPYNGLAGVAPYAGLHAGFAGVAPYAGLHAAAPLVAAAPLAAPSREAVKTTIKLNPGHAVFYRVD